MCPIKCPPLPPYGFGMVTEIDEKVILKNKTNVDFEKYNSFTTSRFLRISIAGK